MNLGDWEIVLQEEFNKEYFKKLINFIDYEYDNKICFPKYEDIFNALKYTQYKNVNVVILGQDPYHGEGEAHGLAFSVKEGMKTPPSLRNIFKELDNDLNIKRNTTDLTNWAKNGVLLLNCIMTVLKDKPLSHQNIGWEIFTDSIIKKLNDKQDPIIFILWGNYARKKRNLITNKKHMIIEGVHPSPLSANRGFFGSKPFSKANNFLINSNKEKINW